MYRKIRQVLGTGIASYSSWIIVNKADHKEHKTYIWGNGIYQARPDAIMRFSNFTPKEQQFTMAGSNESKQQFDELCFGKDYVAGIDKKGRLCVWNKQYIDSAMEQASDKHIEYKVVDDSTAMKCMAWTSQYLWAVDRKGRLYQWKINEHGMGQKREIKSVKDYKIQQIVSGDDHLLMLTDKHQVLSMGDDTYGQCGVGINKTIQNVQIPNRQQQPPYQEFRIPTAYHISELDDKKITKIVSGVDHSLAINGNGQVWGWGNNSHQQLSHQKEYNSVQNPMMAIFAPKLLYQFDTINNNVVDAAAGDRFSIFVTRNKEGETEVYGCGHNIRGQLGIGVTKHLSDLTRIENLSNFTYMDHKSQKVKQVEVEQIKCGRDHCIVLMNVGALMVWGDNEWGQMGNGRRTFIERPAISKYFNDKQVVKIFAGENSTAAFVKDV